MKFNAQTMGYIKVFENTTGAQIKDCFFKEKELVFIVKEGDLGRALGKKGSNIRKLAAKLKHPLRIIGFDQNPIQFVKNILHSINGYAIEERDSQIIIKAENAQTRGKIYGRDRSNLKWINELLKKYFNKEALIE